MAYTVPRQWSRGDDVTAARLNVYSTGQVEINTLGANTGGSVAIPYGVSEAVFTFQHVWPYLHFGSTGEIIDPDDADNTVSISAVGASSVYDLRSVEWLYPGKRYRVEGVSWCVEEWEP